MAEQRLQVSEYGEFLGTRHRGRQIYNDAETTLSGADTLVLDFTGVQAVTVAFADELVANLIARSGPRIVLAGMDEYVAESVEVALSRREDLP
jgi:hypothetical protein